MRLKSKLKLPVWLASAAMLPLAALAQTVVPSLSHVPAQIRDADGQAQYAEQMAGTDVPDGMGWDFACNQSPWRREVLRALLLPDAEPQQVAMALRPWSRQAGHYLLLACVMAPEYKGAAAASCGSDERREVVVALLRADAAGRPQLAARPWHEHLDEAHATASSLTLSDHIGEEVPGSLLRWDMADYRLNADTLAFGIRTAFSRVCRWRGMDQRADFVCRGGGAIAAGVAGADLRI